MGFDVGVLMALSRPTRAGTSQNYRHSKLNVYSVLRHICSYGTSWQRLSVHSLAVMSVRRRPTCTVHSVWLPQFPRVQRREQMGHGCMSPRHRRSIFVTAPLMFSGVSIFCPWTPWGLQSPRLSWFVPPLVNSWLRPLRVCGSTNKLPQVCEARTLGNNLNVVLRSGYLSVRTTGGVSNRR